LEAKLLKVFCMGNPELVPSVSQEDWHAWRAFVSWAATEEFEHPITITEWRPVGHREAAQSLHGVAYHVVDNDGNVHKDSGGGYHIGKLEEESAEAPVEDWSVESNLKFLPAARRLLRLHNAIFQSKAEISALLDGLY